jgi:hypothetical protein
MPKTNDPSRRDLADLIAVRDALIADFRRARTVYGRAVLSAALLEALDAIRDALGAVGPRVCVVRRGGPS